MTPFPSFKNGRDNLHHNYGNTTYGQDIFAIPTITHFYGLHLIAQNIGAETTILENPSEKIFNEELHKGYDIVGIYFVIPFFLKVLEMCRIARKLSPNSKILLGGPGVQCFSHSTGREDELLELVDGICRGEGVQFFRELLKEDVHRPIQQDLPLGGVMPFRCRFLRTYSPTLISVLGCTNSCEFCASSSFYGNRRIQLADPAQLFAALKNYMIKYNISSARILDENLLLDKDYVQELGHYIRNDPLCQERNFSYSTFANISAIDRYDCEELLMNGINGLLIGVESKFVDRLSKNVKRKLEGKDLPKIFRTLTDHGINTEGSMILGWDFHDPENILEDIEFYVSLHATFDQIVCLVPVPETKLWNELKEQGRLSEDISWEDFGFYAKWYRHKNFDHEQLWKYEDLALHKTYTTWGPSYLRLFEVHLKGYRKLKDHTNPFLRRRADAYKDSCKKLYPVLDAVKMFSPSTRVANIVTELKKSYFDEFGKSDTVQKLKSLGVDMIAIYRKTEKKIRKEDTFQPKCEIYRYNRNENTVR
jgi:radical SAM superfamily enzyme YgiQ (UPF0313 family)